MGRKVTVTGNGDVDLTGSIGDDELVTIAWAGLNGATMVLKGRIVNVAASSTGLTFPLNDSTFTDATVDSQGNAVKSTNVNARVSKVIATISGYVSTFDIWVS